MRFWGGEDGLRIWTRTEPPFCSRACQHPRTCHTRNEQEQWGLSFPCCSCPDQDSPWGCEEDIQDHQWHSLPHPNYRYYVSCTVLIAVWMINPIKAEQWSQLAVIIVINYSLCSDKSSQWQLLPEFLALESQLNIVSENGSSFEPQNWCTWLPISLVSVVVIPDCVCTCQVQVLWGNH